MPRVEIPHGGLSYACLDCPAVFYVNPDDPFEAHGKYLDHIATTHDDDHESDEDQDADAEAFEDPTDSCSCTWIDDPQCEYHHGPEAGY